MKRGGHGGHLFAAEGTEEFVFVVSKLGGIGEGVQLRELFRDEGMFPFASCLLDVGVKVTVELLCKRTGPSSHG